MKNVVKNTINVGLAELICPHFCISCGRIGSILCPCCKKYIKNAENDYCLACGTKLHAKQCVVEGCQLAKTVLPCRQFYVAAREGLLRALINEYKYNSARAAAPVFAELLYAELAPYFAGKALGIVVLPTIAKHVRQRSFDHIGLLARVLASFDPAWRVLRPLKRATNTVQVGAERELRCAQAKKAYALCAASLELDADLEYLLLDDVWTTGSSMMSAYEKIFQAGARKINIAIIAKTK